MTEARTTPAQAAALYADRMGRIGMDTEYVESMKKLAWAACEATVRTPDGTVEDVASLARDLAGADSTDRINAEALVLYAQSGSFGVLANEAVEIERRDTHEIIGPETGEQ